MFLYNSWTHYWMFLYREMYGSINMHNYMSNYMIIICWKSNGNYVFNGQLTAINGEPWPITRSHRCFNGTSMESSSKSVVENYMVINVPSVFYGKRPKKSSIENQRVTKKLQKKARKIWSVQKKAVILHPLSRKTVVLSLKAQWSLKDCQSTRCSTSEYEKYSGKQRCEVIMHYALWIMHCNKVPVKQYNRFRVFWTRK